MIHSTAIIYPNVWIDEDVHIGPYCVIGGPPEHREFYGESKESKGVRIYRGSRIHEMVTVHAGTVRETVIGNNVAIFNKSHVAHDCILDSYSTIGGQVSLAGHTRVMSGATVSGMSCTHQHTVIGAYAFIGGASFVTKDVPPGEKWVGYPARFISYNDVGLQRADLDLKDCLSLYKSKFDEYIAEKK
jgi:UDP-N-acetylglucosamine acyltransferase